MPPKIKFEQSEIVQAALSMVREHGWKGLSARSVARKLGASSKPIYGHFQSMTDLEEEVVKKIVDLLFQTMTRKWTDDPWHAHGIGYAMFGLEEKNLFLAANDEAHVASFRLHGRKIWNLCTASLADYPPFQGLNQEQIFKVQMLRWLLAHGLAFQAAVQAPGLFLPDIIRKLMIDGSEAILDGLIKKWKPEQP